MYFSHGVLFVIAILKSFLSGKIRIKFLLFFLLCWYACMNSRMSGWLILFSITVRLYAETGHAIWRYRDMIEVSA